MDSSGSQGSTRWEPLLFRAIDKQPQIFLVSFDIDIAFRLILCCVVVTKLDENQVIWL
jgi:hypothetical protein